MRKIFITLLVVLGLALLVVGVSLKAFPQWLSIPGGVAALLVAAALGVAELGGKLKDWRDFLFGEKEEAKPSPTAGSVEPPSVNITGNKLFGKNKIAVRREKTNVADNLLAGENEIEVGAKPGPKPKKGKQNK